METLLRLLLVLVVTAGSMVVGPICGLGHVQGSDFSLSGYLETQLTLHDAGKATFLNSNKFKLSLQAKVNEWAFFDGDIVFLGYQGETEVYYDTLFPARFQSEAAQLAPLTYTDESYLDNAYCSLFFSSSSLKIGKQPLIQGSGFAWNPSDVLTDKDPFEPGYEKPGINALVYEYRVLEYGTAIVTFSPEETWSGSYRQVSWRQSIYPLSFRLNFGGIDAVHYRDGVEQQGPFYYYSGEILVPYETFYIWGEFLKTTEPGPVDRWLIGAKYLLTDTCSIMTEYYVNGWGKSAEENYSLTDWLRASETNVYPLAEEYIQYSVMIEPSEQLTVIPMFIQNLSDGSYAVSPSINLQLSSRLVWTVTGIFSNGCDDCEFSDGQTLLWTRLKLYL